MRQEKQSSSQSFFALKGNGQARSAIFLVYLLKIMPNCHAKKFCLTPEFNEVLRGTSKIWETEVQRGFR